MLNGTDTTIKGRQAGLQSIMDMLILAGFHFYPSMQRFINKKGQRFDVVYLQEFASILEFQIAHPYYSHISSQY